MLLTVAMPARADACSCAGASLEEQIDLVDLAAVGQIVEGAPTLSAPWAMTSRYTLRVDRATTATGAVMFEATAGMCGTTFTVGERVLLLVYRQAERMETNGCVGNRQIGDLGAEELATVERLLPHVPALPPPAAHDGESGGWVAVAIAGALAMLGGMAVLGWRLRSGAA